ncbi:hypothetical protein PR003_g8863 [Phytophthora rubi]|uniref:Uncharacterized protein n=1 Tax=Phytophthora rubi TaxID=129364 RepID=A0A6A4FW49_9STRA|nr:hypothetical protein PR003_g8863 [Phytophthora rubi]
MAKFEMSEGTPSVAPALILEQTAFPHLTTVEWQALHRLAAVLGEFIVTSLLSSAIPDQQRQAIQEFMERGLAEAKRRVPTPSHTSQNDAVKMETSTYSGAEQDRFPLNRWFREVNIAIASRLIEAPTARVNFLLSRLSGKANKWAIGNLVVDWDAFPTLESLQSDLRLAFEPPQDESRKRATFFALQQGKMSMRDYVLKTRHLVSCIVTNPRCLSSARLYLRGPGEIVVKLAEAKPHRAPRRAVSLPYTFDGFSTNNDFLEIELNYAFDCILGMPWLARYQPEINWLDRSVRRRVGYDVTPTTRERWSSLCGVRGLRHWSIQQPVLASARGHEEGHDRAVANNAVEQRLPHVQNAVEQRFSHKKNAVEQWLPFDDDSVAQQDTRDTGMVETDIPCLEEGEVSSSDSSSSET